MTTVKGILAIVVGTLLGVGVSYALTHTPLAPQTIYMPDAQQGSEPVCISNRSKTDLQVANGPVLHPGEFVAASVEEDYNWGFTYPAKSSDQQDVDCFVIEAH